MFQFKRVETFVLVRECFVSAFAFIEERMMILLRLKIHAKSDGFLETASNLVVKWYYLANLNMFIELHVALLTIQTPLRQLVYLQF